MKKETVNPFQDYAEQLNTHHTKLLEDFWSEFNAHCLIAKCENEQLREDCEKAILCYHEMGVSLERALELLDPKNLGGFYARPSAQWFALDDAAKIYPFSMEHGKMSVFRISVYLKEDVVSELLQMALNFIIHRFPTFATTLKKGFFWHYLDMTKRRFAVQPESDVPCQALKVSASGSQSFRVLYFNNRISIECFHALTDGAGAVQFVKVLIAEYLRLCGTDCAPSEYLWDVNALPSAEEFENALAKVTPSKNSSGFVNKKAVQMNGRLTRVKPCRVLHFKMNAKDLKVAAHKYKATVTTYLLALMFLSIKASTDTQRGESSIQVPVDMRKFYPSKTLRNFSMYCGIRLPLASIESIPDMIGEIEKQLNEKGSQSAMTEMVTAAQKLVRMIRFIPLLIKQPVVKFVVGLLGDKIFTTTLSNLGVVQFPPELTAHIDSMDFVLGTAVENRASCGLVTAGNTATFSISKMTVDPSFEEKLYDLLTVDGIEVCVEGSAIYEG